MDEHEKLRIEQNLKNRSFNLEIANFEVYINKNLHRILTEYLSTAIKSEINRILREKEGEIIGLVDAEMISPATQSIIISEIREQIRKAVADYIVELDQAKEKK